MLVLAAAVMVPLGGGVAHARVADDQDPALVRTAQGTVHGLAGSDHQTFSGIPGLPRWAACHSGGTVLSLASGPQSVHPVNFMSSHNCAFWRHLQPAP
ncbi:hypothetical protein GCM10023194_05380 [Planotetraspora phitsanulokensis]|uniref:Uncharacterized protein n=1 Tax=Planotetraspora phitsanulokensis TaxID=575192 RepID=A0A8J3XFK5_9ACTN|nr:hypothetical protein Pph01_40370 [Planotetraspora phitsanulokensis]